MSVIQKLIYEIKQEIPLPVLEVAFMKRMGRNKRFAGGLDWEIRNKVIDARVAVDLNFMGGETVNVPLNSTLIEFLENYDYRTVIRIPLRLTQGRPIAQVIAFNYFYNKVAADLNNGWASSAGNINECGNSPMMQLGQQVLRAASPAPVNSTANVELIGENVIVINDYMGKISQGSMTCRLTHDKELSAWNSAAIFQLAQFAIMATKAWIWTNTIVDTDIAYLYGGAELGRIQQIIDGYADANQNYIDYREQVIQAVNFTQDKARHQVFLRGLIAGQSR